MYVGLQAASLLVWKAATVNAREPLGGVLAPATRTHTIDVVVGNAEEAIKIIGGCGINDELSAAEFLEDAWTGSSVDGTRDVMRLGLFRNLRERTENLGSDP